MMRPHIIEASRKRHTGVRDVVRCLIDPAKQRVHCEPGERRRRRRARMPQSDSHRADSSEPAGGEADSVERDVVVGQRVVPAVDVAAEPRFGAVEQLLVDQVLLEAPANGCGNRDDRVDGCGRAKEAARDHGEAEHAGDEAGGRVAEEASQGITRSTRHVEVDALRQLGRQAWRDFLQLRDVQQRPSRGPSHLSQGVVRLLKPSRAGQSRGPRMSHWRGGGGFLK
mmetsp:Transcript_8516/g.21029  ORF Transcript_8516/g.21029 Transcript_8516/m.21029 type:complete len:225 (-) Transcript_8516:191-865(-)